LVALTCVSSDFLLSLSVVKIVCIHLICRGILANIQVCPY
jgi:hypothetical protein